MRSQSEWTTAWEIAGLLDEQGLIGGTVAFPALTVPDEVELDETADPDGVGYPLLAFGEATHEVEAEPELLSDFLRLAQADEQRVLTYARRWGRLGLCGHGVPYTHHGRDPKLGYSCAPAATELVRDWWGWSRAMQTIVNLAADLRRGHLASVDDWRAVFGAHGKAEDWQRATIEEIPILIVYQRALLQGLVNAYLVAGDVRPRLSASARFPITISGPTLWSQLVVLLMNVVGSTSGLYFCDWCGRAFAPRPDRKRPQTGRRVFCDECRADGAPQRAAARDYSERKRRQRNV